MKWAIGPKDAKYITRRNLATSVYLLELTFISFIPAVLFWKNSNSSNMCFSLDFYVCIDL
ncbi:MAG: hypothetical protein NZ809_05110 [Thermodesulfovibrio sp.]|nr:hypothetical protein [Thermodesulfovibrio sp.]